MLADWHGLKTMVSAVMRLGQPLVLMVMRRWSGRPHLTAS